MQKGEGWRRQQQQIMISWGQGSAKLLPAGRIQQRMRPLIEDGVIDGLGLDTLVEIG